MYVGMSERLSTSVRCRIRIVLVYGVLTLPYNCKHAKHLNAHTLTNTPLLFPSLRMILRVVVAVVVVDSVSLTSTETEAEAERTEC